MIYNEPKNIETSEYNYKASQSCIGIDYSFSGVNVGFVADGEAHSVELEQTDYHESILEKARDYAKTFLGTDKLQLAMGISECASDSDCKIDLYEGRRVGFNEVHLLYESIAAAIGAYWNEKNTVDKTIASCVFRGNVLGDSTSFGVAIIEIKNGLFVVKKLNGRKHRIDNHVVKEVCLTTIRELNLKHIDEVLIVGQKDFVTKDKPLIKAVRTAFRKLFEGECKYVREHENLVAKGLALYGNSLDEPSNIIFEIPQESGVCNE